MKQAERQVATTSLPSSTSLTCPHHYSLMLLSFPLQVLSSQEKNTRLHTFIHSMTWERKNRNRREKEERGRGGRGKAFKQQQQSIYRKPALQGPFQHDERAWTLLRSHRAIIGRPNKHVTGKRNAANFLVYLSYERSYLFSRTKAYG